MQDPRSQLIKELAKDCKSVADIQDRLKSLFKPLLQAALEAEMDEHLGYSKHSSEGDNSGNSRNGYSSKTVKSGLGQAQIQIPRDRNGEFEPNVIRKCDRNVSDLENQIITMYAKGLSTRDIEDQIKGIYGVDVSPTMVSKITDRIMPLVTEGSPDPLTGCIRLSSSMLSTSRSDRTIASSLRQRIRFLVLTQPATKTF